MKLTPEEKAFFEYGKAIEKMNSSKKRLRGIWRSSENIVRRIGKASIIEPGHKKNIKAAWQKRAACRARQLRRCETCLHRDDENPYTCDICSRSPYASDNWEPRKEGE